jgi:hypothetical protein
VHLEHEVYAFDEHHEPRAGFLFDQRTAVRALEHGTAAYVRHEARDLLVVGEDGERRGRRRRDLEARVDEIHARFLADANLVTRVVAAGRGSG